MNSEKQNMQQMNEGDRRSPTSSSGGSFDASRHTQIVDGRPIGGRPPSHSAYMTQVRDAVAQIARGDNSQQGPLQTGGEGAATRQNARTIGQEYVQERRSAEHPADQPHDLGNRNVPFLTDSDCPTPSGGFTPKTPVAKEGSELYPEIRDLEGPDPKILSEQLENVISVPEEKEKKGYSGIINKIGMSQHLVQETIVYMNQGQMSSLMNPEQMSNMQVAQRIRSLRDIVYNIDHGVPLGYRQRAQMRQIGDVQQVRQELQRLRQHQASASQGTQPTPASQGTQPAFAQSASGLQILPAPAGGSSSSDTAAAQPQPQGYDATSGQQSGQPLAPAFAQQGESSQTFAVGYYGQGAQRFYWDGTNSIAAPESSATGQSQASSSGTGQGESSQTFAVGYYGQGAQRFYWDGTNSIAAPESSATDATAQGQQAEQSTSVLAAPHQPHSIYRGF